MKTYLTLILLFILNTQLTFSQVPDSVYYKRLFYVCKAWGHIKYFHSNTANGSVNWDNELLVAINGIKNATDNVSFNDSLLVLLNSAGEMEISSNIIPVIPDSLNNVIDNSWIQNSMFSTEVSSILDTVKNRFRPQSNIYVDKAGSSNPTFNTDSLYYSGTNYPSEEKRLLALFRYWNIINYYYPYKNIMDQSWDSTLIEAIPLIVNAKDALSYNLSFRKLTSKLNDSHAFYYSPVFQNWLGINYPPFLIRFIENETVITKVLPEITEVKIGDIIKEIDNKDIYMLRDSLREYSYGSNDVIIEREINSMILRGYSGNFSISVSDGNNIHKTSLTRNNTNYSELRANTTPIWRDTIIGNNCRFGIVDMGRLEKDQIDLMFNDLWDTDAMIFDIRNYPNATLGNIVNYLYPSSIHIANFAVPDITYPGRLKWEKAIIGKGTSSPYFGNLILLFNENTQSQAEYTCMGLEQFPGTIKIGSTTSAADGNISIIYLPGNIFTYATFLGTYYPDYTPTQRIGIIPDYEVHPTIQGVRKGQDEVMEFALNCDFAKILEEETILYPNPAKNEIFYDYEYYIKQIEIYNTQGQKIKTINGNSLSGKIDISDLNSGIFIFSLHLNDRIVTKLIIKH